ncbi:MAG: hypothetical protein HC905_30205, partial [Bacteroidales bacterium]|nr:hypothetical protein [Bacteroidales bacterium]
MSLSNMAFNYFILDGLGTTNLDYLLNALSNNQTEEPESKSSWDIQVNQLKLENTSFTYENLADSMVFMIDTESLSFDMKEMKLDSLRFDVEKILISNTQTTLKNYGLIIHPEQLSDNSDTVDASNSKNMIVTLGALNLIMSHSN